MKYFLKIILTFFLVLSSLSFSGQSLKDITFGSEYSLDVISWNLEWFPKNGQTTLDSLALIINTIKPEVIALQEINDVSAFNTLLTMLPLYEGSYSSFSNLKLAYIYKKSLTINNIFTISSNATYNFAGRPPYCLELVYDNQTFFLVNNHLKCCGDGALQLSDSSDEECRRLNAMTIIKQYIDDNLNNENVIVLGDLNDILTDNVANNIFQDIINDSSNYVFADIDIANGPSNNWSYPNWPSHIDHILITNELFPLFENDSSYIDLINVKDFLAGGFSAYDNILSDHVPIGMSLHTGNFSSLININNNSDKQLIKKIDLMGREAVHAYNQPLIYIYNNGEVEKKIFVK